MARVVRRNGRRGRTIPARSGRTASGRVGLLTCSPLCRRTMDTRGWTSMSAPKERARDREGSGQVRRTAAVLAGALLLLAGCNDGAKSSAGATGETSSRAAEPAQVAISLADGSTDVSPVEPLEITVTGGALADVTLVDAARTPGTRQAPAAP